MVYPMILEAIHFRDGDELLYAKRVTLDHGKSDKIVVVRNGIEILCIETHLAVLLGDCLRHMGGETDFKNLYPR
jgi:hypothetical protein